MRLTSKDNHSYRTRVGLYRELGRSFSFWAGRLSRYLFFLIPLLLYALTCSRTPGWIDATLIVSNVYTLQIGSWVNVHNLFHLIGHLWLKLFPQGNIHFVLVLLSALFGAAAVHVIYLVGTEVTGNRIAAAVGAASLMISHSLWWHSTMLEVYTLNALLISLMFLFVVKFEKNGNYRYLYAAGLFFGLGCSNHGLMGLFVFAFLGIAAYLLAKKRLPPKAVLLFAACAVLGASLYLYAFARDYVYTLQSLRRTAVTDAGDPVSAPIQAFRRVFKNATGGEFKRYMFPKDLTPEERRFWRFNYPFLAAFNYASPALFFALAGFWFFGRRKKWRMTFLYFLLGITAQVIWSANYFIWDMYAFAMPVYLMLSIPIIFGLDAVMRRGRWGRLLVLCLAPVFLLPGFLYTRLPALIDESSLLQRYLHHYPEIEEVKDTWNAAAYVLNPNKRDFREVEEFAEAIFQVLPKDAHYWTDDGRDDYPLRMYYRDIYHRRTDIRYHSLFGPFMDQKTAEREAGTMKRLLEQGKSVYLASLGHPHRWVLEELFFLLNPEADPKAIEGMGHSELPAELPGYRLEKVAVLPDKGIYRYRFSPRE